jgi:ABC-type sugar transport system ATPase subunit
MISRSRGEGGFAPGRKQEAARVVASTPVFRARDLVLRAGAQPIDITIRRGEILGFSGLDGHGQAEFLAVMAGIRSPETGAVEENDGASWHAIETMREAVRRGICYVPRDRKNDGLFPGLSVLDNYALPTLRNWTRMSFIDRRGLKRRAEQDLAVMRTRYASLSMSVSRLSGGNQQKVLLSRWLAVDPRVIILDDPLRGVDAATKAEIYDVFRTLAGRGVSLLFLSTEIEELLTACDRVVVFREAEISRVLEREALSREAVVAAMFGQAEASVGAPEAASA